MNKYLKVGIIIIASLALIGYVLSKNKKENEAKIAVVAESNASVAVKVANVKSEVISLDFVANGNFQPIQELTFSAEKTGRVIELFAKEGDQVTIGQTLAIMRGDAINVSAEAAEVTYQNAKTDYSRFENAYKTGGVTKQQLDQAKVALKNAEANYEQAKINLGDTKIKAPINGIINKRFIEKGSMLTATPTTNLFEIVNVSKLKLNVTVDERQVTTLKVGDEVNIKASVYPNQQFKGKITFIAAKADNTLNFPIEIEIENTEDNQLKAGMYGTATFSTSELQQKMTIVPRTAFVGSVSSNQIFVVEDGIAKLKTVTAGKIIGDQVEILNGLSVGEVVVTTGQINLEDGNAVEVIN